MKKASEVFKSIRFAKTEPRDKPHSSTDEEGHYTVGEKEYNQQLKHVKKMAMQEAKEKTEYDYEGDMARSQLQSIINNAQRVHDMLKDNDNLPEWVQSKITLAEDYISTVANYMMSEIDEEVELDEASSAALRMQKALQRAKEQREREQRAGEALLKPKPQPPVQKEESEKAQKQQGLAEGSLTEMDKSSPQPGRDGKVSHKTYGSRDNYKLGDPERMAKQVSAEKAKKDALNILKKQGLAEGEKNPHTSALGKALYRDLSKQPKLSPQQVQRNKERWEKRQAEREQRAGEALQKEEAESEERYCPKCDKMEKRSECAYGTSYWDKYAERINEEVEYLEEKNAPTNPDLWSRAKALAKSKFDVYPSAYANGWAAKWYKSKGGGWKTVSEEVEQLEEMPGANMDTRAVHAHLKKKGWSLTRSSGGHDVYTHPEAEHHIAVPRHRQLKAPLVKGILKQSIVREDTEQLHELSDNKLIGYLEKVHADSMKHKMDPTKRSPQKANKSVMGFSRAMNKLEARPQVREDIEIDDDIIENAIAFLNEGRPSQRHPLEGHEYHRKTNAELEYIAKDAHKAAEAMKGHNTQAENKYRDQANDSATVRYYRQKHGMADWYKKKYGHVNEEVELDEGLQQTLRKYVPGYAKKQIDKKMDAGKFGKRDVDKDTNYWRYKKVQDKLKKEEVEITEGKMKQLHPDSELPDAEPIKRPDIPFTPDKPKKPSTVAGKYGSGYSTAKHLAKQAMKKQSENLKKPRLQEEKDKQDSKKAKIVRDVVKNGKTKTTKDTFEANPELTSEIIKT